MKPFMGDYVFDETELQIWEQEVSLDLTSEIYTHPLS